MEIMLILIERTCLKLYYCFERLMSLGAIGTFDEFGTYPISSESWFEKAYVGRVASLFHLM